jgi:hypothetical protein
VAGSERVHPGEHGVRTARLVEDVEDHDRRRGADQERCDGCDNSRSPQTPKYEYTITIPRVRSSATVLLRPKITRVTRTFLSGTSTLTEDWSRCSCSRPVVRADARRGLILNRPALR